MKDIEMTNSPEKEAAFNEEFTALLKKYDYYIYHDSDTFAVYNNENRQVWVRG